MVISVSDTPQGGAVALLLVIRQVDGTTVGDPYEGTLLDFVRHDRPAAGDDDRPGRGRGRL